MAPKRPVLCVVGLGYVGLPLAHAFAREGYEVHGYDVSERRIAELARGHDATNELTDEQLRSARMHFSADPAAISKADVVIMALPTPVDERNKPDLTIVEAATSIVGKHLKRGAIVVYESTVYPGVTEEICGPILEKESGLICGKDFTLGYSPERINPGDKQHTVDRIVKVVAGQDAATLDALAELYGSVVKVGVHRAPSIKVAEMAKAIENAQRDLNIAYVNEIALFCNKLGIRTKDVIEAAGTKWNFLKFQPGLVGGHCIGVDPYYLVEKARMMGMETHVIAAGRAVNDGMAPYVARRVIERLPAGAKGSRVLVLGCTFKEDIPDTRNSKVMDVVRELKDAGCTVLVHEPHLAPEALGAWGMTPGDLTSGPYDAVLYLVPHAEYRKLPVAAFADALKPGGVLYDLKGMLDGAAVAAAGRVYMDL